MVHGTWHCRPSSARRWTDDCAFSVATGVQQAWPWARVRPSWCAWKLTAAFSIHTSHDCNLAFKNGDMRLGRELWSVLIKSLPNKLSLHLTMQA